MHTRYLLTATGLFLSCCLFSQSRLVLHNDAFVVIDNSAKVVIANSSANAVTTSGTGGNIVTESEFDQVIWNIGSSTGTYVMPFASQGTWTKIPFTAAITAAGTGSGSILFSTYPGPVWDNNTYRPTDVTHMYDNNTNTVNNSSHVIDRFWVIDAQGYGTKPTATFQFTYLDAEHLQAGNTILEPALGAQRFNSAADVWGDYMPQGVTNITSNTTSNVPVTPANFFRSWTLSETTNPLSADVTYFKSSCAAGALLLEWQTISENGVDAFAIEQYENGQFMELAQVPTQSGSGPKTYFWQSPVRREGVFRLTEISTNGDRFVKSELSASCIENDNVIVSYNGETGNLLLSFDGAATAKETLHLYDAAGRLVYENELEVTNGPNTIVVPELRLSHGMYIVRLKNGLHTIREKVVAD